LVKKRYRFRKNSFDYAIGEIVDAGIDACEFIKKEYYLTNVEIPTSEQILDWINGILDLDKDF